MASHIEEQIQPVVFRAKVRLALPQFLLGALTLGYVDHGTYKLSEVVGSIEDRMTDSVNVPDPFFRMNDPIILFEIRFVADGLFELLPARRSIVRMKSMQEFFEPWQRAGRIEP